MNSPRDHITNIFRQYTKDSRLLRSFTNLSNTVIQTALSGQCKFVFEILQNADDAYETHQQSIETHFTVQDGFFIVQHNGKGFDYNDVERICDYASQIQEVKATDLRKTGYKGLGFKSLFNLSDTIYICSSGYSFRFDKNFWPNPEDRPWQIIPIWSEYDELPLQEKYSYTSPVNIILRVKDVDHLKFQLKEVVDHPDLLLYLQRINKLRINIDGEDYFLERKKEQLDVFSKVTFLLNSHVESTWLTKTYHPAVPSYITNTIVNASRFIYPDKIKVAQKVRFTFALKSDEYVTEIYNIKGLCYNTLPTQLHLMLPYHVNSFFILNLDRTQLHENEWNTFLIESIGRLQLYLLRDLASVSYIRNYVISLFVREIQHPFRIFADAFSHGLKEAKEEIAWLPSYKGKYLLKLGHAWSDDIDFFKQNFKNVQDPNISPFLIDYNVHNRSRLKPFGEAEHFGYDQLLKDFQNKYFPQFISNSYIDFISYLFERLQYDHSNSSKLKKFPFLLTKNGKLTSPKNAYIEVEENPIPDFCPCNQVNNAYLPQENRESLIIWLQKMGARVLSTPTDVVQLSIFKWIESHTLHEKINLRNHVSIMEYLAKHIEQLSPREVDILRENMLVYNSRNYLQPAKKCYLPDIVPVKELASIISDDQKLSSTYDMLSLRNFFIYIGVNADFDSLILVRSIVDKIKNPKIFTNDNYKLIIEYLSFNYFSIERYLNANEKRELRDLPLLTRGQSFRKAQNCFFDSAVPTVKGLEHIITPHEIVFIENDSQAINRLFTVIGVSKQIAPANVLRKSVLKWIKGNCLTENITKDNHYDILKYIAKNWNDGLCSSSGLSQKEKKDLKQILILTQNDTLKPAFSCFWPASNCDSSLHEQIPRIETVISSDELVSDIYDKALEVTLINLGVRKLGFFEIYERYCDHLIYPENIKWFFSNLVYYWQRNKTSASNDEVLLVLKEKFRSCSLLSMNNMVYYAKQLYSSKFCTIHYIDPNSVPILNYEKLPFDLEKWLSFQTELDLQCIKGLFKVLEKNPLVGRDNTLSFYKILLEQLKLKPEYDVKRCQLSLLSQENKFVPAVNLYYFMEEEKTCELNKCYLKRIDGMSHKETLELAELCRVNVVPFNRQVKAVRGIPNGALKEDYMERLAFIVVQESNKRNEKPTLVLKRMLDMINSINLYECQQIRVQYPFGDPIIVKENFEKLTLHVKGRWKRYFTEIHDHLFKNLDLRTDIHDIIDMENEIDFKEWVNSYSDGDRRKYYSILDELQSLKKPKESCFTEASNVKEDSDSSEDESLEKKAYAFGDEVPDERYLHVNKAKIVDRKRTSIYEDAEVETMPLVGTKIYERCVDLKLPSIPVSHIQTRYEAPESVSLTPMDSVLRDFNHGKFMQTFDEDQLDIDDDDYLVSENTDENDSTIENIFGDLSAEESNIRKRISQCVFTLLQNHYKNKYPTANFGLLFNKFTLHWMSHTLDIIWKENNESYDYELRKDGEMKQLIKLELAEVEGNDIFTLSHQNINRLVNNFPKNYKKYCSYVLSEESSSPTTSRKKPIAVYKIVPMQQFF